MIRLLDTVGKSAGRRPVWRSLAAALLACCLFSGCTSTPVKKTIKGDSFEPTEFLQSDGNRLATLSMRDNLESLERLLDKLYRRNPAMWQRSGASNREAAIKQVMRDIRRNQPLSSLGQAKGTDAVTMAFSPEFQGDRAGGMIYGLGSMLMQTYGDRTEHYMLNGLNAQQVANASYNVEVAAWMLASRKTPDGRPMLLSNSMEAGQINLSFEREFGKIVGRLDLIAASTDEKYRRTVINYVQGLVAVPLLEFLPVFK